MARGLVAPRLAALSNDAGHLVFASVASIREPEVAQAPSERRGLVTSDRERLSCGVAPIRA